MAVAADRPDHRSAPVRHGMPKPAEGCHHGEVFVAEQRLDLRCPHQLLEEAPHDLLIQQPVAVLGERGGVPDRIIRAKAHKPAVQQVVVQLL